MERHQELVQSAASSTTFKMNSGNLDTGTITTRRNNMKTLITALALVLAANTALAHSGVATTEEWMSLDNPHNVSPTDTPEALSNAGETLGEFLKDAHEDIGKAAHKGADFINKL